MNARGLIRQHQFSKVRLVKFNHPSESDAELEKLTNDAEDTAATGSYRVMALHRRHRLSTARPMTSRYSLPGQNYRGYVHAAHSATSGPTRQHQVPRRREIETGFVHTLNGSGLAVGRTLVAILENYQQADGSVIIPPALRVTWVAWAHQHQISLKS